MRDLWVGRSGGRRDRRAAATGSSRRLTSAGAGVTDRGASTRLRRRGVLVTLGQGRRPAPRPSVRPARAGAGRPWLSQARARCSAFGPRRASTGAGRTATPTTIEVLVPRGRDHRTRVGRFVETRWLPPDARHRGRRLPGHDARSDLLRPLRRPRPRAAPPAPVPRAADEAALQRLPRSAGHDLHDGGSGPRRCWPSGAGAAPASCAQLLEHFGAEARADRVRRRDAVPRAGPRPTACRSPERQVGDHRTATGFIGTVDFAWRDAECTSSRSTRRGTTARSTDEVDDERDRRLAAMPATRSAGTGTATSSLEPDRDRTRTGGELLAA